MKKRQLRKQNKHLKEELIMVKKNFYMMYKLLDDIDTTSDIYKENYKARLKHIDSLQKQRHRAKSNLVDEVYDLFYRQEDDILTPYFEEKQDV